MNTFRNTIICLGMTTLLLFSTLSSHATIISVDGAGDTGITIDGGQAVGISFQLNQAYTNVSIGAPLTCIACSGGVWLHSNVLGSAGSFGDSLGAEAFDGSSTSPFFTASSLDAGLYFLIVSIDSGFAVWDGSSLPVETIDVGAMLGLEFFADGLSPFVPFSDFDVLFDPGSLHYSVTGDVVTQVPLPATLLLFLSGMPLFLRFRFRRD